MVGKPLTAAGIQVAQPHAVLRDAAAVCNAQILQVPLQLGRFSQTKVTDAELAEGGAAGHQVPHALFRQTDTAAQVQVAEPGTIGSNGVKTLVLQSKAVGHVQVEDGEELAGDWRQI